MNILSVFSCFYCFLTLWTLVKDSVGFSQNNPTITTKICGNFVRTRSNPRHIAQAPFSLVPWFLDRLAWFQSMHHKNTVHQSKYNMLFVCTWNKFCSCMSLHCTVYYFVINPRAILHKKKLRFYSSSFP